MPENAVQWLFFLFFAIGSVGGWVALVCLLFDAWALWRKT